MSWPPSELLAAVRAAPDDAPRLVLADWLQERGQACGELIALPCALAHETTVVLILSTARAQNPRKYGMKREVEIADARHLS